MGPLDVLWHALNFLAPAAGVAAVASALAKLLWRGELAGVGWLRLMLWGSVAGGAALMAGLVIFGRDGKVATYGLLVAATAGALWAAGFLRR